MTRAQKKLAAAAMEVIRHRGGTTRRLAVRLDVTVRELKPVLTALHRQKRIGCDCGKYYHRDAG